MPIQAGTLKNGEPVLPMPVAARSLRSRRPHAYTWGEVVFLVAAGLVLVAALGTVAGTVAARARKMACLALMRTASEGVNRFAAEHFKPPLPPTKDDWDTVLGDPGGKYPNQWLVGVLQGSPGSFQEGDGRRFDARTANPKGNVYATFPHAVSWWRGGIGTDGNLYDPWGRTLVFALNSRRQDTDSNHGFRDRDLQTWGMADYAETRPGLRMFAAWSYGADGAMGTGPAPSGGPPARKGSDDVTLW